MSRLSSHSSPFSSAAIKFLATVTTAALLLSCCCTSAVLAQSTSRTSTSASRTSTPTSTSASASPSSTAATSPRRAYFLDEIFEKYGVVQAASDTRVFPASELEHLYESMNILPKHADSHDDHDHDHEGHDHEEHEGHNHGAEPKKAESHEGESHEGHNHSKMMMLIRRQAAINDTCIMPEMLLDIFGYTPESNLTRTQFSELSPALVYLSATQACASRFNSTTTTNPSTSSTASSANAASESEEKERPPTALIWIYSIVANLIITLTAVLGIVFVPLMTRSSVTADLVMSFFISLAVGVLASESLLHLIPEVLGVHSHEDHDDHGSSSNLLEEPGHEGHNHGSTSSTASLASEGGIDPHSPLGEEFEFVWIMSVVMLGLYLFWVLEKFLRNYLGQSHHHHHHHAHSHHHHALPESHDVPISSGADGETTTPAALESSSDEKKKESFMTQMRTVKPVAILVMVGDALHNFVDGLAIGASFATSLKLGLATSIAVLLHEIPHELGDYSVLLASGVNKVRAALLNAGSNLTAFIGSFIGIALATSSADSGLGSARKWILALAAGNFLYIALVDLIPELNVVHRIKDAKTKPVGGEKGAKEEVGHAGVHGWKRFAVQSLGIAVGWLAMVLLALYGENLLK
ncbi:hypothetical protein HK102_004111 [Quaeritorhiza haematococci]|nr:hypothetical protein HK102_004111 [Quaeritorhiza haematococci]